MPERLQAEVAQLSLFPLPLATAAPPPVNLRGRQRAAVQRVGTGRLPASEGPHAATRVALATAQLMRHDKPGFCARPSVGEGQL